MQHFEKYFKDLQGHKLSDITEHSHRKSLQNLIEDIAAKQKGKFKILHEPKREGKFGSPDFKITSTESILGYIENKKVDENLDKTLKSDQIKKYKELSKNIILTNYIDWVWLKDGEEIDRQSLCSKSDIENKKSKLNTEKAEKVEALISKFFSQAPEQIANAKVLAEALAIRAKRLKEFLFEELTRQKDEDNKGRLYQLFETFRQFIFHELSIEEFADAFAQNLVYGLFLAKLNADNKTVDIYNAKKFIPNSFDLIRELVNFLDELDNEEYRETKWIVEEVLTILNNLNLKEINRTLHYSKTQTTNLFGENEYFYKDPFVYFYEHFLSVYDKKLREAKGVYYTPPPVVNFIVRGINDVLKNTFKIKDGLASKERVTVLDFATGTGTFLLEVFQQIFDTLPKGSAKKDIIVKEHILQNIYGFEYLIAPYTIAHLKLSQFLKDQGYNLEPKERLQVFLTNTLEPIEKQIKIPLLPALTEESKHAQDVKDKPILVITGNPPYSGHSKNNGPWISSKIKNYFFVDGKPLGERNSKWLQDDYVKFIRFAQDKMEAVEEGIVAVITNHRFLTNPTFRGMRQSLMKTFDHLYFIDLHGSNKPKEFTPEGDVDENVFDIEQGVAISILIKKKGLSKEIYHADFWGKREEKYKRSVEEKMEDIKWSSVKATAPFYLFIPQKEKLKNSYNKLHSIKDIFKHDVIGFYTGRDDIAYSDKLSKLKEQVLAFNPSLSFAASNVQDALYRPFDVKKVYYTSEVVNRPRKKVMPWMLQKNVALTVGRFGNAVSQEADWNLVFVSEKVVDLNVFSRGGANVFPLYIYHSDGEREPNIKEEILDLYGVTSEELMSYIYCVLHSPSYRKKYKQFLNVDFPRIPFTDDKKIFSKLSKLGQKLINAHLLKDVSVFDDTLGNYMGGKNHTVEKINYITEKGTGKLFINKTNYFNNVPPNVYDFYIGGYEVLDKYLKDRKGNVLASGEMDQIENIIRSLAHTIETMKEIDKLTKDWI